LKWSDQAQLIKAKADLNLLAGFAYAIVGEKLSPTQVGYGVVTRAHVDVYKKKLQLKTLSLLATNGPATA